MSSIRRDLEQRALRAILANAVETYKQQHVDLLKNPSIRNTILKYAFFKPTNALLIAFFIAAFGFLALFIFPFLGLPFWLGTVTALLATLFAGGLAEGFFLYRSLSDEQAHAQVIAEMLRPRLEFNPATIRDKNLGGKVDKALEYWSLIDETVQKASRGPIRDRLLKTTQEVTHWLQAVYNLADRVDKFHDNKVIERDLLAVPKALENYRAKLALEDNPEVRRQLERTIADKERQLRTLENLQDSIEKADYQLESTISALGTIYSQLLLAGTKDEEASRLNRLQEEISEQVYRLEDLTEAMDDVYRNSG
ncbi:MAG: hypothetical protein AB1801_25895 [Chloroflexota bacterium]